MLNWKKKINKMNIELNQWLNQPESEPQWGNEKNVVRADFLILHLSPLEKSKPVVSVIIFVPTLLYNSIIKLIHLIFLELTTQFIFWWIEGFGVVGEIRCIIIW